MQKKIFLSIDGLTISISVISDSPDTATPADSAVASAAASVSSDSSAVTDTEESKWEW